MMDLLNTDLYGGCVSISGGVYMELEASISLADAGLRWLTQ